MSVSYHCDGCGVAVENPAIVGKVVQRDYCETCAGRANRFVDAEEALRRETQQAFAQSRAKLIADCSEGNFKLPDVP